MVSCLKEKGWDAEETSDNGVVAAPVEVGLPEGQEDRYETDRVSCEEDLGFDVQRTPSQEQLSATYEAAVQARQCMIEKGYDLPEVPSEGVFIDAYQSGTPWEVTQHLPTLSQDEADELYAACPPPEWFPVF